MDGGWWMVDILSLELTLKLVATIVVQLRVTVVHLRVTIGHLRVTIGHFRSL